MVKTVNEGFTEFLARLVPTEAQRTSSSRHRESVKAALTTKLVISRFFETGSFTHGTGIRGYSDVDVFASLGKSKPESSYTALTWVKDALSERFPTTTVVIDRPAVKVKFGSGTETWEIIPAFVSRLGSNKEFVYDIPGPSSGSGWIESAPDAHLSYVQECNRKPESGDAKALARLAKAWKYYCNVPISSFYLEMRAAQHTATQSTYIHVWDICQLLEKFVDHELAAMNDPQGVVSRFHPCSSESKHADALSKTKTAAGRARKALDAYSADRIDDAFYYLNLLFGDHFPAR